MKKKKEKELMCKTDVINKLGISPSKFDQLDLRYENRYINKYGKYTYLYKRIEVIKLSNDPLIESLKKKVKTANKDYSSIFDKRYSNYLDSLPLICEYMFNLNRYTKHSECSKQNKEEIYYLKNKFIKFLYDNHYCISVKENIDKKYYPELKCKYCYGCGCEKCEDTGIYRVAKNEEIKYYCFYFSINNVLYCWHQPQQYVDFDVELSTNVSENLNSTEIKVIKLGKSKFKEAKELISWFLSKDQSIKQAA